MSYYYFPMDDKAVYLEEVQETLSPEGTEPSLQNTTPAERERTLMVVDTVIPKVMTDPLCGYLKSYLTITNFMKSNGLENDCYLGFHSSTENNETLLRRCAILKKEVTKDQCSFDETNTPEDITISRFVEKGIQNQFEQMSVKESEGTNLVFKMADIGNSPEAAKEHLSHTKLSPLFESQFSPLSHTLERIKHVFQKVSYINEVKMLLEIAGREIPDTFKRDEAQSLMKHSFVVIEGMDATGKTTLTTALEPKMEATRISQPPQCIMHLRAFFDDQPEIIRRSYYILGNYITAVRIAKECQTRPVIADRFWHSSAVNAIAIETSDLDLPSEGHVIYTWPRDLLLPDLVLYLRVTEELRTQRMRQREDKMTDDERQLEDNACLRKRLREAYRRMYKPSCVELDASGSKEEVLDRVSDVLLEHGFH